MRARNGTRAWPMWWSCHGARYRTPPIHRRRDGARIKPDSNRRLWHGHKGDEGAAPSLGQGGPLSCGKTSAGIEQERRAQRDVERRQLKLEPDVTGWEGTTIVRDEENERPGTFDAPTAIRQAFDVP